MKKLFIFFIISLFISACTLKKVEKHHGVHFLNKKQEKLTVNQSNKNDILISLTTSGNSKNVINAIKKAKKLNLRTILMSGNSGGKCVGLTDLELIVPSTSTARIQEMHMLIGHTLCELIEEHLNLN